MHEVEFKMLASYFELYKTTDSLYVEAIIITAESLSSSSISVAVAAVDLAVNHHHINS